jgi:hypothetical protein
MSYAIHPTVVPGDTWTASNQMTYVAGNFTSIWVGTTAGDMDYYSSATTKQRIGIGSPWNVLRVNSGGTAPEWGDGNNSITRYIGILVNDDVDLIAGNDKARLRIPAALNGFNIISVAASRKSGTGTPSIQIRRVSRGDVDVLSVPLTIDSGETDSSTAGTPAVINTANDDVQTGDQFAIDVDVAGTSTLFLFVEIGLRKP